LLVLAILGVSALLGYIQSPILLALLVLVVGFALLLQYPGLGLVAMTGLSFTLPLEISTGSDVALSPPILLIPATVLAWVLEMMGE
jgi:hypothetical protein